MATTKAVGVTSMTAEVAVMTSTVGGVAMSKSWVKMDLGQSDAPRSDLG
jgi:hypothetical protein